VAQDLEPRAYSASPIGVNFLVLSFGRSTGSVLLDPTLPVTDVHATLNLPAIGFGHTFGVFGRQSLVTVGLPYVWGDATGNVAEQSRRITRSGLADLRMKFSLNLHGNPALTPVEFASRKDTFIVGTSVSIVAPTGQYDPTKLINLGTNRWAFKPEIGISYPFKKFYLDAYCGAWLFTRNAAFYPGDLIRKQDPITSFQVHMSYTFRSRLWLAADATWYGGGATWVNNAPPTVRQNNSRAGLTLSLPAGKRQSLKLAYSSGTTSTLGTDFSSYRWLGSSPGLAAFAATERL
jgi:hypothetical protein